MGPKKTATKSPPPVPPAGPMDFCLQKMKSAAEAGGTFVPVSVKAEPSSGSSGRAGGGAAVVSPAAGDTPSAKREIPEERRPPEEARPTKEAKTHDGGGDGAHAGPGSAPRVSMQAEAAQWIHDWIRADRTAYNAFMHRLRKQGQDKKCRWKDIQKFGYAMDAETFVEEIMATSKRQSSEFNNTLNRNETLKQWTTFKKALEKYDEDVLIAMIRAKTLESKRDPAIPESLMVPWPKYLQVKLASDSELERRDEGLELTDHTELDDDAYDEKHAAQSRGHQQQQGGQQQQPHQQPPLQTEPSAEKKMPEAVAVAVKAARQAHGTIDRFVREIEAAVDASQQNENSKGCKIEIDLDGMKVTLTAKDKELLAFERKCVASNGATITEKEIKGAAAVAEEVVEAIKSGRKKMAALKSLRKL